MEIVIGVTGATGTIYAEKLDFIATLFAKLDEVKLE